MLLKTIPRKKAGSFQWIDLALFLAVATIPWYNILNSLALILFCVTAFFTNSFGDKKRLLARDRYWLLPIVYYLLLVASIFWDNNGLAAAKMLEKHTSFLVLPLLLASVPVFSTRAIKTALLLFVASVIIVSLACLLLSYNAYLDNGDSRLFFYHYLAGQMKLNAIYLSMYALFSILILLWYSYLAPDAISRAGKTGYTLAAAFLGFMILLLSSKMMISLFLLLSVTTVLYLFHRHRMLLKGSLVALLLLAGTVYLLWQLPYVKWRIQMLQVKPYENSTDNQNGLAARRAMWESAVEVIGQRPLLGYGLKGGNDQLVASYKEHHFELGFINHYNTHNVYLQVMLAIGFIGLVPVMALLIIAVARALKRKNFLFIGFLCIVLAESFTESLLEAQKGTVFVLLFLLLLFYHSPASFEQKK